MQKYAFSDFAYWGGPGGTITSESLIIKDCNPIWSNISCSSATHPSRVNAVDEPDEPTEPVDLYTVEEKLKNLSREEKEIR